MASQSALFGGVALCETNHTQPAMLEGLITFSVDIIQREKLIRSLFSGPREAKEAANPSGVYADINVLPNAFGLLEAHFPGRTISPKFSGLVA